MKRHQTTNKTIRRSGFTLLELLIVLGIILAIAAMVVPNLLGRQEEANIKQTRINIANFEQAAKQWAATHPEGYLEGGEKEVVSMLMNPTPGSDGRVVQPYLEGVPKDAWGKELHYSFGQGKYPNDVKPAIWSDGPNMKNDDGGNDDITNWSHLTESAN